MRAFGIPVFTGGPDGSGIPEELELLDEEEELLLELELLELELELELEFELELDELELPVPGLPLELLLPPHAAKAAAKTSDTLALVNPIKLTDGK